MDKRWIVSGNIIALGCTLLGTANAADEVNADIVHADNGWATEQLDEVVVTGSRTATKLSETPLAIGVVDEQALKRDKPKTMGDVVNRIAGVSWNDLGNEQHSMGIRQPNSTNAVYQYLEDGIPIRPLGVFNHNSLNELNLAGAERVEVVKGAASSLYGSNAVGGAVNFITARPSATPEITLGARCEKVAGYRRVDTGVSNTWGGLGMRFTHYSSRRDANNWQEYSNGSKDSATLRADYTLDGDSLLHMVWSYSDLDSATPGSLNPDDFHADPGKSYQTFSWRRDKSARLSLGWEGETVNDGLTSATLFTRRNDHAQLPNYTIRNCVIGATCPTGYRGTQNSNQVESLGLDVKHQQEFEALSSRLIAGAYYDNSPNSYVSNNLDVTRDAVSNVYTGYAPNTTYATGARDYSTGILNTALFAQWEFTPLEKVRVVLGGRHDRITYDFTNNLAPGADFGAASETRSFSHFSPKLGATFATGEQSSVYVNLSQGFTPPEVSQLYGKSAVPDLMPSTYNNYELGLRAAIFNSTLKLDAAIYRLDGTDTIVSYTPAVGASENRNAGATRSEGLEIGLGWESDEFDGRLGASVTHHRYVDYRASDAVGKEVDYSGKEMKAAPNMYSAEIGYKPMENVRVALEVVKQGPYWMNDANTVRYDGHTLLNLRGSYKFAKGWEVWLQGRNLTDQLYADSASSSYTGNPAVAVYNPLTQDQYTAGAPRSIMVGLNYTYGGQQ